MIHHLKCWPEQFEKIRLGLKTHEVRTIEDREFNIGDILVLHLWDPVKKDYVEADPIMRRVTYITPGGMWGLPPNLCCMSIPLQKTE